MTDTNELVERPMTTDDLRKLLTGLASRQEGEGPDEFVSRRKAAREAVAIAAPTILQRLIDTLDVLERIAAFPMPPTESRAIAKAALTPTQTGGSSNG